MLASPSYPVADRHTLPLSLIISVKICSRKTSLLYVLRGTLTYHDVNKLSDVGQVGVIKEMLSNR